MKKTSMKTPPRRNRLPAVLLLAFAVALGGCAGQKPPQRTGVISDPLEPINRVFWDFNHFIDRSLLRPGARLYRFMFPPVWQRGIGNAFENLEMPGTIVNDVLQLKLIHAVRDTGRFAVNTTIGGLGVWDVASKLGMPPHSEDFGQTLGRWGVPSGPYLVPPFLPPTNLRDFGGFAVDVSAIQDATEDANPVVALDACDTEKENEINASPPYADKPDLIYSCGLRWEDEAMLQSATITVGRADRLRLDKVLELQADQYVFVREFLMRNRIQEIQNGGGGDDDDDDDALKDELLDD